MPMFPRVETLYVGTNDFGDGVPAVQSIASLTSMVGIQHSHGIKAIGSTLISNIGQAGTTQATSMLTTRSMPSSDSSFWSRLQRSLASKNDSWASASLLPRLLICSRLRRLRPPPNYVSAYDGVPWADRFKSVLLEGGEALAAVAAYIELNPVRAGLCVDPKDYRYCGYAEALAKGFSLAHQGIRIVLGQSETTSRKEVSRQYRKYLFVHGSLNTKTKRPAFDLAAAQTVVDLLVN